MVGPRVPTYVIATGGTVQLVPKGSMAGVDPVQTAPSMERPPKNDECRRLLPGGFRMEMRPVVWPVPLHLRRSEGDITVGIVVEFSVGYARALLHHFLSMD